MFKFLTLVFVLFLSSCATKQPATHHNKALFAQEDFYILAALRANELHNYHDATKLFSLLYEKTKRKEYLYSSLHNQFQTKEYKKILQRLQTLDKNDPILERMKISLLITLKQTKEATQLAYTLASQTNTTKDYILYANLLIQQKKYKEALLYLQPLYEKNFDEIIMEQISIILYKYLDKKDVAITKLQLHIQLHGCSKPLCIRLSHYYVAKNDIDKLLEIYLKLYRFEKNAEVAQKIIQIYKYKQNFIALSDFLEKTQTNDKILLQIYTDTKKYKKASLLAQKIYDKNGEVVFLAQSAIFEYESLKDKNISKELNQIIKKLDNVIEQEENPLYLNYLGYLLIDHEIDINKGIKYVEKALKEEPKSIFYLDSLAWGYFKKGQCNDAKKVMQKVLQLQNTTNTEVQIHLNAINECLKN